LGASLLLFFTCNPLATMDDNSPQFGPGFLPTFLYYFTASLLITALVSSQLLHLSMRTGIPLQLGVIVGLASGLLGGLLNRTTLVTLPIKNRATFTTQIHQVLTEMGYHPVALGEEADPNFLIYERSLLGRFFSGRVYVELQKKQAIIASRASVTQRVAKAL
jgi:hypothetical protein